MYKSNILFILILSSFIYSQNLNIHSTDGSITQHNLSDIDSITFTIANDNIGGIIYGNFGITDSIYADQSDWDAICDSIFGSEYRVADWNDLVAFYNNSGDLLGLFDGLGLTEYNSSAFVTRDGVRNYSSTRYYYTSRHEHNKPGYYLAHENIDNYLISLGSWYTTKKIMVRKK